VTKALGIDPATAREPGEIVFSPVPLNVYQASIGEERQRVGDEGLIRMLRDMTLLREFEVMLDRMKRGDAYAGVRYNHLGPAHLSIGQEAAAVGEAFFLGPEDHIYGSHRSHGEIIAKGLAVIAACSDGFLQNTMESYVRGDALHVVEDHLHAPDVATRAVQFLLYGLLAEIFGRTAGFNRGMGGSMHAFFPPFGVFPNNAIVGGSADLAAGAALFKKLRRAPGIVIANIGDGSTGCGPVWEAMNFATMGQFNALWDQGYRGGLPVIFAFVDNFYAMGGQTVGETMGYDHLSRIGAALNARNMHAETVDGNNPLAVADAIRRARRILESGDGPILLDLQCYRQSGHSASDASSYRSREELEAWRAVDPLIEFGNRLEAEGVLNTGVRESIATWTHERVAEACRLATDLKISPRLDLSTDPDAIGDLMFSHVIRDLSADRVAELSIPLEKSSRVRYISGNSRSGLDENGDRIPPTNAVTMRDALFESIAHHFAHDDLLVGYGEENRDWDGAFGVYRGLTELLPYHRFFNTAISEAAIVGTAVGYALEGGRALVELMYADFMGRAGDELFNQLAKWQAMSGGVLRMPVVVRVSVGNKYGAQHSQEWTSLVAHIPGLKVVFPVTPYDAKGLMASALSGDDPVIFFESQRLYDAVETFHPGGVPPEYYRVPMGEPDIKRHGKDLTILTIGATLYRAIDAADRLASQFGLQAEVIDARSLVPFDYAPVLESVKKTGRILLTSDAVERGSYVATLAAEIGEMAFDDLDAPISIVGARNWISPPTEMENVYLPQPEWLLDAIHTHLLPLPGYTPATPDVTRDRVRRAKRGA
jgi:2-oxoisovalerate dehydrogenase E1 component